MTILWCIRQRWHNIIVIWLFLKWWKQKEAECCHSSRWRFSDRLSWWADNWDGSSCQETSLEHTDGGLQQRKNSHTYISQVKIFRLIVVHSNLQFTQTCRLLSNNINLHLDLMDRNESVTSNRVKLCITKEFERIWRIFIELQCIWHNCYACLIP